MNGFQKDYDKLFQLFQTKSTITPTNTTTITATTNNVDDEVKINEIKFDNTSCATQSFTTTTTTSDRFPFESSSSSSSTSYKCKVYKFTFCQFIECFQQLKFSTILSGHRNINSLREFYDHINEFLIERLSPHQSIEIRIFSFYLMYALWFLQKKCHKLSLKIRCDKESYSNLKDLVRYMSRQQQFDIVLAYRKLFLNGAFIFCENIKLYGPYYKDYLLKNSIYIKKQVCIIP